MFRRAIAGTTEDLLLHDSGENELRLRLDPPVPGEYVFRWVALAPANEWQTRPSATQVTAPSSAGTGTPLVDLAAFPTLLGAAFDNDLLNVQGSAFTVNLNAFAFAALTDPGILDAQSRYAARKYRVMRRTAGSLSRPPSRSLP